MGLIDAGVNSVVGSNSFLDAINPFRKVIPNPRSPDFPDGFVIEEVLAGFGAGIPLIVKLVGNMMPQVPFTYGGEQQVKKDYYPGNPEPAIQILGPREKPITIKGRLYDKRVKIPDLYGLAEAIADVLDTIRKNGNMVKITMGNFQRFAILDEVNFDMKLRADIHYTLTFTIISDKEPSRCPVIEKQFQVPEIENQGLALLAAEMETARQSIPLFVPRSLAELLNSVLSDVFEVVNSVTGFVDDIISEVEDLAAVVNRAVGAVKNLKTVANKNLIRLGKISYDLDFFGIPVPEKYSSSVFIGEQQTLIQDMMELAAIMQARFKELKEDTSQRTYLVKRDDSLQRIAMTFYGNAEQWSKIFKHNKLITIPGVQHVTRIVVVADVSGSLDGKTFILFDDDGTVAFWIDVDNSGTVIPPAALAADRAVEITDISTDDSATDVGAIIVLAINNDDPNDEFTAATSVGGTFDVTNKEKGTRDASSAGDTGFTVTTITEGVNQIDATKLVPGQILEIPKE